MRRVRDFFCERNVIEVDCPLLSDSAAVDAHIDLIEAQPSNGVRRYLHSSPEYGMKRLLSEGMPDLYQLSHVFRDGEIGLRHNPEFMMAEWYRIGMTFSQMVEETKAFIRLFLPDVATSDLVSYKEAFIKHCALDPFRVSDQDLVDFLKKILPDQEERISTERDDLLNQILALAIEPHLGHQKLSVFAYYPPTQAALAQTTCIDGDIVSLRFEIYYEGVELANGYFELQDAKEQLKRFEEANRVRKKMGKEELPIDFRFLEALQNGLPQCSGVAVGFDRLMMLRHNKTKIQDVISYNWTIA